MVGLTEEDIARFADRLTRPPTYTSVQPSAYTSRRQIAAVSDYRVGDLVRTQRTSGQYTLGVVVDVSTPEMLHVLVRSQKDGRPSLKDVPAALIGLTNPLKIGVVYMIEGVPFWVTGLDEDGELNVESRYGDRVDPLELRVKIESSIRARAAMRAETPPRGASTSVSASASASTPTSVSTTDGTQSPPASGATFVATSSPMPARTSSDPSGATPGESVMGMTPAEPMASGPTPSERMPSSPTQPLLVVRPNNLSSARVSGRYVPIELILKNNAKDGLFAGNKETQTVYDLVSPLAGAALHTDRGQNYKNWNEDGGALFADGEGRLYLGVFDQAGGEGSDDQARGAASAIAAEMLFAEMQAMAKAKRALDSAEEMMVSAATKAHRAIVARGRGEVTTFVGAVIDRKRAVIVNVGDSGAIHFSPRGRPKQRIERQGIGRLLLEGLGIPHRSGFQHQTYVWKVDRGDLIVFGTDGLFDSGLSENEIGRIVVEAGTAANATRRLRDVVRQRMFSREGKPDNLTVLVVRVGVEEGRAS
ncbi:MAG: SpoIIE family protein phosphatase [Deltaproteobacteria bacterium]|nr:SpoIIE family protein phosphatase [Deltaproteobacteria bacterium]